MFKEVNRYEKLVVVLVCLGLVFSLVGVSLAKGYSKKTVCWVQQALKTLGYYQGEITGRLDESTREAIKAFQKEKGLKVDGIPGRKKRRELKKALKEMEAREKKPEVKPAEGK